MDESIHELSAGYALDALAPEERTAFEAHLGGCARCQEEVGIDRALIRQLRRALAERVEDTSYVALQSSGDEVHHK